MRSRTPVCTRARFGVGLLLAILLTPLPGAGQNPAPGRDEVSVVWLVRHAERADDGRAGEPDPELSETGRARAAELGRLLSDAGITTVHSTPFNRTRQTAAPLAERLGLAVQEYDPRDPSAMEALLERLRTPGRHVVVGHSNTTPDLVARLGGDPGSPIAEMEYDRIYVLVLGADGSVTSTLLRFGAPAPGD